MNFRTIFIIMILNVTYICCSPYLNHVWTKRSRLCGPRLTEALRMVCRGEYASRDKKSFADILEYHDYDTEHPFHYVERDYPFVPKEWATSVIPQRLRRNGVVDECCYKSCSIKELQSYCAY
ncbi:hypothetical protein NQ318_023013 [Aromia moschata]|uniref:Insulin-like domain-containing protein n=1 Tax=Aromia moschata TaxID=1265417 RepID=A0AAV8YBS0_9CUCU|nr:hypothetical protein NQ318_023013 [Aromia moschata]